MFNFCMTHNVCIAGTPPKFAKKIVIENQFADDSLFEIVLDLKGASSQLPFYIPFLPNDIQRTGYIDQLLPFDLQRYRSVVLMLK